MPISRAGRIAPGLLVDPVVAPNNGQFRADVQRYRETQLAVPNHRRVVSPVDVTLGALPLFVYTSCHYTTCIDYWAAPKPADLTGLIGIGEHTSDTGFVDGPFDER